MALPSSPPSPVPSTFALTLKTKKVSTILGGKAQPRTKLNRPHGVAIAPDGALWVCDSWNDRVVVLRNY